MPATVEYCLSSCESGVLRAVDADGVDLRERRCLEHCGICRDRPLAVVDGRVVDGTELSTLLDDLAETPDDDAGVSR
jgi:uncharacterized protein YuzB (UPF0349 family)